MPINISNGNISGAAHTDPNFQNGNFNADVVLNTSHFKGTTREFVINAFIHEIVHAYLLQTNNAYRLLPKEQQHNFMFANFNKDIAAYLISRYNMPKNDAWALAWSGSSDLINDATGSTPFAIDSGQTMVKDSIAKYIAPYGYVGTGSKGSPTCKPKAVLID